MAIGKHAAPSPAPEAPRSHPGRRAAIVVAVVAAVLACAYGAGTAYYWERFLPHTNIGGVDVSGMDGDAARAALDGAADGYALALEGEGFSLEIAGADIGLAVDDSDVEPSTGADALLWLPRLVTGGETREVPVAYDEQELEDAVRAAVEERNAAYVPEEGEQVSFHPVKATFVPADELEAEQIDAGAAVTAAQRAVEALEPDAAVPTLGETTGDNMPQPSAEVQAACDEANALLGCDMRYTIAGSEVARIDSAAVSQWVDFGSDGLSPALDTDAVSAWAREEAASFNSVGKPRSYTRADGKEITVEAGEQSAYGWKIDATAFERSVSQAVAEKRTGEEEVATLQEGTGYTEPGGADWGAYVDVDITEQHARYYNAEGELLWESGIVTGNPNQDNDTPQGVYQLNGKKRDIVLRGQTDPKTGEPTYESPVSYWMSFIGNLYGLHDASWQPEAYFEDADAYLTHGSHGCVNLPVEKASELYEIIQVGDVVVIHE